MSSDLWVTLGAFAILFGLFVLFAIVGFWVWALVDAASRPREQWTAAGHDKDLWLWGVIVGGGLAGWFFLGLGGFIGPLVYVLVPRREMTNLRNAPPRQAPRQAPSPEPHPEPWPDLGARPSYPGSSTPPQRAGDEPVEPPDATGPEGVSR